MGTKGDTGPAGPRGYPGSKGLTGDGPQGPQGPIGTGATITDNGDGTFTITGANGSIVISDGSKPLKGTDYFDGASGDYVSFVYFSVPTGNPVPNITDGTGSFDGLLEIMPDPVNTWQDTPDYTPGKTTYVSSNRYVHDPSTGGSGTWTLKGPWKTPRIYVDPLNGQTQFISYAFVRSSLAPGIPDGGTYASPVPTTVGWSDGIPNGTGPVYMAKRLFTSDGASPQDIAWSSPKLLGEAGSGTKHQFAELANGNNPIGGVNGWHDTPTINDAYMVVCTQDNVGNWVCDTANPIKIKGEVGPIAQTIYKAFAFKRSAIPLVERPDGGNYDFPQPANLLSTGWTENVPTGTANLYISTRMFASDGAEPPQDSLWSIATLFSGDAAVVFRIEADAVAFVFDTNDANPVPDQINYIAYKQGITNDVYWTTVPDLALPANRTDALDDFYITAAEFGVNISVKVTATAGASSDTTTTLKVKDGSAGASGTPTDEIQVKFQFAPDSSGSPGTWHNSPLLVSDVWLREATFVNGASIPTGTDADYSVGTKIVGNDGANTFTEFWFSNNGIGDPVANPSNWGITQESDDIYAISRTTTLGLVGPWGAPVLIRGDDGVTGKYFETRFFARSLAAGAPSAPLNYNDQLAIPNIGGTDWVTDPNIVLTGDQVLWAISATKNFDGTLDTFWSAVAVQWSAYTPVRGTDFNDGTGVYLSKVYKEAPIGVPPAAPITNSGSWDGVTEINPTGGWADDPMSVSAGNAVYESQFLYVSTLVAGVNTWPANAGTWSSPVAYAYIPTLGTDYYNGTDGVDGDGSFHAYVFKNYAQGFTPDPATTPPSDGSYDGPGTEVLPIGWTDDPVTPPGQEVTWITERTYIKLAGVWQSPPAWSDPSTFSAITSLVVALSDEVDTITTDFNGESINWVGNEGGSIIALFGINVVTDKCTYTVAGGTDTSGIHSVTQNGLTFNINNNTGLEGLYDVVSIANQWSTDKEIFIITITHDASGAFITKRFSFSKNKIGDTGVAGTANRLDIAYGIDAAGTDDSYPPSADPVNRDWIGTNIVTWIPPANEPIISLDFNDYEWTKFNGSDGLQGIQGPIGTTGVDGTDGVSIAFQGSFADVAALITANGALQDGWAYYDTTTNESYVYRSGVWYQMSVDGVDGANGQDGNDGTDGLPIVWKGESATPPLNPQINWVYKDTDNNQIYIYNDQLIWELMVNDGTDGADGSDGSNGFQVYITYHDNSIFSNPGVPPAGDGTSGGWHTNPTAASNWMSQKVVATASSGVWGVPIQIVGDTGAIGNTGNTGNTGASGLSNRVDFAYAEDIDGNGYGVQNVVYPVSGPVTPTDFHRYLGTNVVTWVAGASEPVVSQVTSQYEWSRYTGNDGIDGKDALTILNYIPALSLPADNTGAVTDYSNTGTTLSIYEGETKIVYDAIGTTNGTWDITSISDVNIVKGAATPNGGNAVLSNVSGMALASSTAFITFQITGRRLNGTAFTAQATQVFSKAGVGDSALVVSLSNASHTIPTDALGANADYNNSSTLISVLEGAIALQHDGVGTSNGTFKVTAQGSDIAPGAITDSGANASVGNASNMTAGITPLTASVAYTITGKTLNGTSINLLAVQSFNKNLSSSPNNSVINSNSGPVGTVTTHNSQLGNPILVTWYYAQVGDGDLGDYAPGSVTYKLFRGATELDSVTVFAELDLEGGAAHIEAVSNLRNYTDTPGIGIFSYTITKSRSWSPLTDDTGTVTTNEAV